MKNSNVSFSNAEYVVTGHYHDSDFTTEFFSAAAELYTTNQKVEYLDGVRKYIAPLEMLTDESWRTYLGNMRIYAMSATGFIRLLSPTTG
ncbi:MAG: glycoside hydrolase family 9 protein [Acidiferrobacterales bacterium]|nr:glycoside hydrolase family 9 protein [Acidiferrobacterales bacterium]